MKTLDSLRLADIVTRPVLGVQLDCPLVSAARRMGEMRVSCLVAMDGETPSGIITERDLVSLLSRRPRAGASVGDIIRSPIITAPADLDFRSAYSLLRQHGIRHLIAIDPGGALAGVATATDFRVHLGLDRFHHFGHLDAVMDPAVSTLPRSVTLAEALEQMTSSHLGYVLITENGKPLGILTERDIPLLLAAEIEPGDVKLHEVMSTPVHTIPSSTTPAEAAARMAKLRIRHIAVIDDSHQVVGMLSQDGLMEKLGIAVFDTRPEPVDRRPANDAMAIADILARTQTAALRYAPQTDTLSVTPPLQTLLGHPGDWHPIGLAGWLALIHPDDLDILPGYLRMQDAAGDTQVHEVSCRLRAASGEWLPFRIRSAAQLGSDGEVLEVDATLAALAL